MPCTWEVFVFVPLVTAGMGTSLAVGSVEQFKINLLPEGRGLLGMLHPAVEYSISISVISSFFSSFIHCLLLSFLFFLLFLFFNLHLFLFCTVLSIFLLSSLPFRPVALFSINIYTSACHGTNYRSCICRLICNVASDAHYN